MTDKGYGSFCSCYLTSGWSSQHLPTTCCGEDAEAAQETILLGRHMPATMHLATNPYACHTAQHLHSQLERLTSLGHWVSRLNTHVYEYVWTFLCMMYSTQQSNHAVQLQPATCTHDKCRTLCCPAQQLAGFMQVHLYRVSAPAFSHM